MVDVSDSQRPSVRVKRFVWLATLFSASFAFPVHLVLEVCGDPLPIRWVLFAIHRHEVFASRRSSNTISISSSALGMYRSLRSSKYLRTETLC